MCWFCTQAKMKHILIKLCRFQVWMLNRTGQTIHQWKKERGDVWWGGAAHSPSSQEIPKLPFRTRLALMGPRDFRQAKTRGSAQSIEQGRNKTGVGALSRLYTQHDGENGE